MAPRIKIEDVLPSGEKISVTLEGATISKNKVLQIIDMLSILSGRIGTEEEPRTTLKERIWNVLIENFGDGEWFTIRDAYNVMREAEPGIKMSTIATYLSRFVSEGRISKRGRKPGTKYKLVVMTH